MTFPVSTPMRNDQKERGNRFSRFWEDKDLTNAFFIGMLSGILLLALAQGVWVKSGLAKTMRLEKLIPANKQVYFLVKSSQEYLHFSGSDGSRARGEAQRSLSGSRWNFKEIT